MVYFMAMTMRSKQILYIFILVLSTVVYVIGMRFLLVEKEQVHYHANFAVYIDGRREMFDNFSFYEEVTACDPDSLNNPRSRVHLHDNNPSTVHIHDSAATWGHLFANLGYALGDDVLATRDTVFTPDDTKQLRFILNGKQMSSVSNRTIDDRDVLLIDYSDSSEPTLLQRFSEIPRDAGDYNAKDDPASCAGSTSESFWQRLRRTIGF